MPICTPKARRYEGQVGDDKLVSVQVDGECVCCDNKRDDACGFGATEDREHHRICSWPARVERKCSLGGRMKNVPI